jgi:hypothetical protein
MIMTYVECDAWAEHLANPPRDRPIIRPQVKAALERLAAVEGRDLSSHVEIVLEEHIERTSRT